MSETVFAQGAMETRNKSEKIFERYLNSNGFRGKWTYEPSTPRKKKKPDYLLNHNGQKCFFEVRELRKKPNEPEKYPAFIDPYSSLRDEIDEAREKFKEYKNEDYSCLLVVFNIDDRQARLRPNYIFAAMLGNEGFEMDLNTANGKAVEGSERLVFLNGGKMVNPKSGESQNTTINAIVVLEGFRDDSEIQKALVEKVEINMKVIKDPHSSRVLRVVVTENPFARMAFPEGLFVGPFDERWRWIKENGEIERVFAGSKLRELEELKGKS